MVKGLLITFVHDLSGDELAQAVMQASQLPWVGTVEPIEDHPRERAIYDRARREIEQKLLAAIPAGIEPELVNRLLRALHAQRPPSDN